MKTLKLKPGTSGINVDQVVKWELRKGEITPELSKGDIFDLVLVLGLVGREAFHIHDLDVMAEFDAIVRQDEDRYMKASTGIGYYVSRAKDYQSACERNEVDK